MQNALDESSPKLIVWEWWSVWTGNIVDILKSHGAGAGD